MLKAVEFLSVILIYFHAQLAQNLRLRNSENLFPTWRQIAHLNGQEEYGSTSKVLNTGLASQAPIKFFIRLWSMLAAPMEWVAVFILLPLSGQLFSDHLPIAMEIPNLCGMPTMTTWPLSPISQRLDAGRVLMLSNMLVMWLLAVWVLIKIIPQVFRDLISQGSWNLFSIKGCLLPVLYFSVE